MTYLGPYDLFSTTSLRKSMFFFTTQSSRTHLVTFGIQHSPALLVVMYRSFMISPPSFDIIPTQTTPSRFFFVLAPRSTSKQATILSIRLLTGGRPLLCYLFFFFFISPLYIASTSSRSVPSPTFIILFVTRFSFYYITYYHYFHGVDLACTIPLYSLVYFSGHYF